jgi:dethiobiotin synthetase
MEPHQGMFIGGTGTGVGKTVVSILMTSYLQSRGLTVAPMKPVETGCSPAPQDALALMAAADRIFPIDLVCPYRLALPAAPQAAALAEGVEIEVAKIRECFESLREKADRVIVEGAGAVATPYAPSLTGIELARKLGLPVLLVTGEKLGTIGQTISSVRALRYARVRCLGVILSVTSAGPVEPHHESNARLIRSHLGKTPFLGVLPHIPIKEGSIGRLPCTLIPQWAGRNLDLFSEHVGTALDRVLCL